MASTDPPPKKNPYQDPKSTTTHHTNTYPFINPQKYTGTLTGKVILITGAGRGIGKATALAFAAAGAHVACLSRTRSDTDALVAEIAKRGHSKAIAIEGDVLDFSLPARAIKTIEAELGPIDVLINNAGLSRISDIEHENDLTYLFKMIDVHVKGTLSFINAVVPGMIARKRGTIINIVSILAAISLPYFHGYGLAKAGILHSTAIMDMELRPKGILTYAVSPGMVPDTTLSAGALNMEAHNKVEGLRQFMSDFVASLTDKVELPADAMVALVAEEDARFLSGRYVDVEEDFGEVLREARLGGEGRVEREGLYRLKVDGL